MKELLLNIIFIGQLTITAYRSVPEQTKGKGHTKAECLYTSIGERVNIHGCAISRDLLSSGQIHYGDLIYIEGIGFKFVNDCMNQRHTNSLDIWVRFKNEEHKIWIGQRKRKVWVIIKQGAN